MIKMCLCQNSYQLFTSHFPTFSHVYKKVIWNFLIYLFMYIFLHMYIPAPYAFLFYIFSPYIYVIFAYTFMCLFFLFSLYNSFLTNKCYPYPIFLLGSSLVLDNHRTRNNFSTQSNKFLTHNLPITITIYYNAWKLYRNWGAD